MRSVVDGLLLGAVLYLSLQISRWPAGMRPDLAASLWDRMLLAGVGAFSLATLLTIAGLVRTPRVAPQVDAGIVAVSLSVTLSMMIAAIVDASFLHAGLSEASPQIVAAGLVTIAAIVLERSLFAGASRYQLETSPTPKPALARAGQAISVAPDSYSAVRVHDVATGASVVEMPTDKARAGQGGEEVVWVSTTIDWPRRSSPSVSRSVKRLVDLTVSLVALSFLSPLMLILAILVRLESRGPALFVQTRVGQHGKTFDLLKFRSMRVDAEMGTGPIFAKPHDPRCTRIGRFMRRHSLDELPQLINVLRGEMSIVGPRPERPYFVARFSQSIPQYGERHREKAGITGWAQINGRRGNTSIDERIEYDLFYVENWSLAFDLKIMVRTIVEILRGHNAY